MPKACSTLPSCSEEVSGIFKITVVYLYNFQSAALCLDEPVQVLKFFFFYAGMHQIYVKLFVGLLIKSDFSITFKGFK